MEGVVRVELRDYTTTVTLRNGKKSVLYLLHPNDHLSATFTSQNDEEQEFRSFLGKGHFHVYFRYSMYFRPSSPGKLG